MEQQTEPSIFSLTLDEEGSSYLTEIAKWSKLLSIIGIILGILMILVGVFIAVSGSVFSNTALQGYGTLAGILYMALGLLYMYPCWTLLKFANGMPAALKKADQFQVNEAFRNLRSCFRFWGIFTLVIIGLYVLLLAGGMLFSAFS